MVNMCPKFEGCIILSNITKNIDILIIFPRLFSLLIFTSLTCLLVLHSEQTVVLYSQNT